MTTLEEWLRDCKNAKFMPRIQCKCGTIVSGTTVNYIQQNQKFGCPTCNVTLNPWTHRRDEFQLLLPKDVKLLTPQEEWERDCKTCYYKPRMQCSCGTIVTETCINNVQQRGTIGCPTCVDALRLWLHRRDDFVALLPEGCKLLTTVEEWGHECDGALFKPRIQCKCGEIVLTTTLQTLSSGAGIGCTTCVHTLRVWKHRRDDVVALLPEGCKLLTTTEEWEYECPGAHFKPRIQCKCGEIVLTTSLTVLQTKQRIGCPACNVTLNTWSGRRDELAAYLPKGCVLLTTPEEWLQNCTNCYFRPRIRCVCGEIVTTSNINNLQQGGGIGCTQCRHKTEGKLLDWLRPRYPDVQSQQPKFKRQCNGYWLTFDFYIPSECAILELDGNIAGGHFDDTPGNDCPVRDLEKEEFAQKNGFQVIRGLQEDVWHDRNGWDNFFATELAKWTTRREAGEPAGKAITPQAPEYLGGVYKRLRSTVDTGPQLVDNLCCFCSALLEDGKCFRCD